MWSHEIRRTIVLEVGNDTPVSAALWPALASRICRRASLSSNPACFAVPESSSASTTVSANVLYNRWALLWRRSLMIQSWSPWISNKAAEREEKRERISNTRGCTGKQMARPDAYRASNFALLHRLQCLIDRVSDIGRVVVHVLVSPHRCPAVHGHTFCPTSLASRSTHSKYF
jgi:hypothetical protein